MTWRVIAASLAITSISTVNVMAQCGGWVLWRDFGPGESQIGKLGVAWYIESGAPDFKSCSAAMQERIEDQLRTETPQFTRRVVRGDTVLTYERNSGAMYSADHYVCLPESVDPRQK